MNRIPPADQAERDRAIQEWDNTFLVEAAAGTGKTTILIDRVLTIVKKTATSLTKVAAITFTEKAAGELKARLRQRLEEEARKDGDEAAQCRNALRELDGMPVSTIHAFCRDLLQQRPVEAGVDPGFVVLDEAAAALLQEEVWQSWIAAELAHDGPARWFLEQGLPLDGRPDMVTLHSLWNELNRTREDLAELHVPACSQDELLAQVRQFRGEIADALLWREHCGDEGDRLLAALHEIERWNNAFGSFSVEGMLEWLSERPRPGAGKLGRKENWDAAALDSARAFVRERFEPRAGALERELVSFLAAPLIVWLKGAVKAYDEAKTARGALDFHDLLLLARRLLRDHGAVREFFKDRYDFILVDEFQDTDPLQAEIVFYLAEKRGHSETAWDRVELDSGKLFLVGDPKQSIYRFRRADLDLYGRVRERITECGECLPIRVNFRSRPELISEVNALFAPWMAGAVADRYEPDYVAMEPYRAAGDFPATVTLAPPSSLPPPADSEEWAAAEAACLAEFVREQVGTLQIPDKNTGQRALEFRDIAVLYATTTYLPALEAAFKARDIPFQASGGRALPTRMEIIALRAVLNALDNPYDETAVVGALRSAFFGCADDELLAHRYAGGRFNYLLAYPEGSPLTAALTVMRELHERRCESAPSEIVAMLFERTAGLAVFALKPQGEARVANLLKVLDIARTFESGGSSSFHRLAKWLDRLEDLQTGEEDFPGDEDDDAVQFLTVHKAKGLEFPVVALYRITQDRARHAAGVSLDRRHKAVEFRFAAGETAGFAAVRDEERDRQRCEDLRLLYVACTRARDMLVVPAFWESENKRGSDSTFVSVLKPRLATAETGFTSHPTEGYTLRTEPRESLLVTTSGEVDEHVAAAARKEREEWERARSGAAAKLEHADLFRRPSERTAEPSPLDRHAARPPIQAVRLGQYVHRLLQHVALPGGENLEEISAAFAGEFPLEADARAEGVRLVRQVLHSPLFSDRIARASQVLREIGFTVEIGGTLVEGAMDLVFFENGAPVIVDFKTDAVSKEEAQTRAASYREQMKDYVLAMEAVLKRSVSEVLLHFLRPGVTVTFLREMFR